MNYVVGGFYSNFRTITKQKALFYGVFPSDNLLSSRDRSLAGFAQATYAITNRAKFTAGFRYSEDRINAHRLPGDQFAPGGTSFDPAYLQSQQVTFHKPSWNFSFDYAATPSLLLYVTQRGSWRAGGFNESAPPRSLPGEPASNAFLPETTKDVEIGGKFNGSIAGVPATAALALYNQWVSNIQRGNTVVLEGVIALLTTNVPKAEITGQEFNFSIRPTRWLSIGGQLSHVNARFTSPDVVRSGIVTTFGPMSYAPEWSGSAFGEINLDLNERGSLSLRGDVFSQSSFYFSNLGGTLNPGTKLPGYTTVDGRLGWNNILGSDVSAALYVKNAFDKAYYAGGLATGLGFGINTASPGRPRTFGFEMRYEF